jgi:hypothetical protein
MLSFLLLLLVAAFSQSHASSAAALPARSNLNQFPPISPLHLQQARWQQRLRQAASSPDATKELFGCRNGNANVNRIELQMLPAETDLN